MKRIYSVILLFSFLVGTLQPILPMLEYQLFEGNIGELIAHSKETGEKSVETIAVTMSTQHGDTGKSLLNDRYYPLGIDTAIVPSIKIFLHISQLYLPTNTTTESPTFVPSPPPPRDA